MNKRSTSILNSGPDGKSRNYFAMFKATWLVVLLLAVIMVGCKKDTFKGEVVGLCPILVTTDPMNLAVDVTLNKVVTITFNTSMNAATINSNTFTLMQGTNLVAGTIAPTANGAIFTFTPVQPLLPFAVYTGTVTTGATDTLKTAMAANYVWSFTSIPQVTISILPAAGGTVLGAGTFAQGSTATVSAIPNTGYTFTNWSVAGVVVSTSASYQFTMAGNKALVANFTLIPVGNFAVNLLSNPIGGGTTSGNGSFATGSTVTVAATPAANYTFTNWTENGSIVSSSSSYQFVLSGNRTLVANFTVIPTTQLAVVLSSNPSAGGSTSGGGTFNTGSSVTVNAIQNTGYTFGNWTENGTIVSTSAAYTFALTANRTLVANFTLNTYTLNTSAINGTVVKTPNQANYNYGSTATLTATPNLGYAFSSWSGDATGNVNPLTVTMNANKNITANFTLIPSNFTLSVIAVNGTVSQNPNQPTYTSGTSVQLTATPNPGYNFTSWSGDATGLVNPLTVNMNSNKIITANFTLIPPIGPGDINLGGAAAFNLLSQTGITTTGVTSIAGDIGVSPLGTGSLTGFGLIEDGSLQFWTSSIVTGKIYTPENIPPTPAKLTTAISDMQTAYTTANNLTVPAPVVNLGAGNISGLVIPPGLYKWSTGVSIDNNASVTLTGGPNDTWVFQIGPDFVINNGASIILGPGVQAKHIYWVVAGQATMGTGVNFYGNILAKTLVSMKSGTKVTGRLLAQTQVTLIGNTIVMP